MMNRFLRRMLLLTGICCGACTADRTPRYAEPQFVRERTAQFERLTGELLFKNILDIWEYQSYLVVLGFENGRIVHLFDKQSGKKVLEIVSVGRGPKEIASLQHARLNGEGVLTLIDGRQQKRLAIRLDALPEHASEAISESPCRQMPWCRSLVPLSGKSLVVRNRSDAAQDTTRIDRYALIDSAGKTLARHDGFPIGDEANRFMVYNEARVSVSADERRMAVGTVWGAVLETFSLERGIEPIATRYFVEPHLEGVHAPQINERTVSGFSDLFAGNERVYGAYDGELRVQEVAKLPAGERPLQFDKIVVFDWEGNPLERIRTDCNIRVLCVSADGTIYAAVFDPLNRFYLGRIGGSGSE